MPSLDALGQFKFSFNNIANEKEDVISQKLPFDDLKLPEIEAPPFEYDRYNKPSIDFSSSDDTSGSGTGSGTDDFDFNAFVNDLPDDAAPPPLDSLIEQPSGGAISAFDDFLNDLSSGSSEQDSPADSSFTDEPLADSFSADEALASEPPASEPLADEPPFDFSAFDASADTGASDDFSAPPEDLLAGFSDEIESSGMEPDAEMQEDTDDYGIDMGGESPEVSDDAAEFNIDDFGSDDNGTDFNIDDFGIDDSGADVSGAGAADTGSSDDDFGSIDMGGESMTDDFSAGFDADGASEASGADADADFNIDDFGSDAGGEDASGKSDADADADADAGIDLGGESQEYTPDVNDDFSMDGVLPAGDDFGGDFGAGIGSDTFDETPPDETGLSEADFSGFDSGTESGSGDESPLDLGDFGDDFASADIELENEPAAASGAASGDESFGHDDYSSDVFGSDDFALSGLDDILNKSKSTTISMIPAPKKKLFGRKKAKAAEIQAAEEEVEEISLTQDDVDNLLRTLASYPLNLRIICQELIAEQVILPQQLSKLIRLLVYGAHVKETALHVESITGKPVIIPKSFEKGSGAAFEAEQSSFAYIFIHNFLPVLRLFAVFAVLLFSVIYLGYNFIYKPIAAESLYKRGYERIFAGEYQRANHLFQEAFDMHRKKKWFYLYAEAFRDQRRYTLAEGKYDELLRHYPRDKKGILDYAALNTYYLMNFEKANRLLQRGLLDFSPNDVDSLLAAGDNFLAWADSNPARFFDRYEDARFSYARVLELQGWQPHVVERMMRYFIRIDDLREVIQLRRWFESSSRRRLSAESLSELGGYLLDKQLERPTGVPNPYIESIESVRDMLLQAVMMNTLLPEPHYHLARYHHNLGNTYDERLTLENAIRAFDLARQESIKRRLYRVDAHYRYASLLINNKEFFPAEEQVVRGIELFEEFHNRNLIPATPQLGQLYAVRGDLEYFVKSGNMRAALTNYHTAERYGYSPPEVQYRMGAAYYQIEDWRNALEYLFKASAELPLNRRMLFALGNAAFQRGDYFAAQGYYNRLLDILELQRIRLPVLLPNDSIQFLETGERLMMARNNAGVVNEMLADQTGNRDFRSRAMVMYAESARAWDATTRNPEFMTRMRLPDSPGAPSINLGYLNANNALRPNSNFRPQIFVRIDRDVLEPSKWEELTAP
ncbi:MAG: tetratricopeptide repeat protein [Treponema sp.]|nr:tetratricopeptide repeat protein [Treponema sp.]